MRLKLPTGRKLAMDPEILAEFEVERDRIDEIRLADNPPVPAVLLAAASASAQ